MLIVRDTREQAKLLFPSEIEVIDKKLDFGDYGCELADGHVVPLVFERKGLGDFWQTLTANYDRFRNEIIRCQEAKFRMFLIVEASLTKVGKGYKHSKRDAESILAQTMTIFCKYKIMPIFCNNPAEASRWIYLFYKAYEKNYYINKNDKNI
jgi:ERCC4-type nuclease